MTQISVYIPTHNRVNLLKRAIESVLDQTFTNFEIIVVDDGSSDGTWDYLSELAKENSKIRVFRNDKPKGACFSRNLAINNAVGTYITGLDDDDYFMPSRLEMFYEKRNLLKNYSFISSSLRTFNDDGEGALHYNYEKSISLSALSCRNIVGNQIFTLTERMVYVDGFDTNLKAWQDYDMWLRLVEAFGTGIHFDLQSYRMDVSEDRVRISNSTNRARGVLNFLHKHNLILPDRFKSRYYAFSNVLLKENNKPLVKNIIPYYIFLFFYYLKFNMWLK